LAKCRESCLLRNASCCFFNKMLNFES
jgi:hypothetical protein